MPLIIDTPNYPIHLGQDVLQQLPEDPAVRNASRIIVLTDHNTHQHCWPRLKALLPHAKVITIHAGEAHKTLQSCQQVWSALTGAHIDRKGLLINLGGGMVGDLGGFSAACYKRGIDFIQVPTTLLSMVDASVGGKTGVNFESYKNQVGAFAQPQAVYIDPGFLETLPPREYRSGYAEMAKHALIRDAGAWKELAASAHIPKLTVEHIARSIRIKTAVVTEDPFEKGLRKILNFGHTVGHALESHFLHQPAENQLLHGEAVAAGMICEAFIAREHDLISPAEHIAIQEHLLAVFGHAKLAEEALQPVADLVLQDKKNRDQKILMALPKGIGNCLWDVEVAPREILRSLRHYQALHS